MRSIVLLLLLLGSYGTIAAQSADSTALRPRGVKIGIGKGITYSTPGEGFSLAANLRMQNFAGASFDRDFSLTEIEARVKQVFLRLSGHIYSPKLTYSVLLGFAGQAANDRGYSNIVYDAILYYRPAPAWSIGAGQAKVRASRAHNNSSGLLQFADRSIVNGEFSPDRDFGIFGQYDLPRNDGFTLTAKASVTLGKGRNWGRSTNGGLLYTGRVELYPLGRFKKKGELMEGDLAHEEDVRILLAGAYSYNRKAVRDAGQRGDLLPDDATRDMGCYYVDFLLKYRGFSGCIDFMGRTCGDPLFDDESAAWIYTGCGVNVQAGYLISGKWEIALRNSTLFPRSEVRERAGYSRRNQTTIGVSRYIVGHALKLQGNVSYNHRTQAATTDYARWHFALLLQVAI
ncbi:MAG: hypothetical protein K2I32_07750 [Alistipes sp.]|nr:hypothetical protein [Alistipes sp.]